MSTRAALALAAAAAALADNVSTWLALSAGAVEINPLVALFARDPVTFALFTAAKVVFTFYLVHSYYSPSRTFLILYSLVIIIFAQATVTNVLSAAYGREWPRHLAESLARCFPSSSGRVYKVDPPWMWSW